MNHQKNTRISALLPTNLVSEMKDFAEKTDTTQRNVIKMALEMWLKKKLDKDTKALSKINFDDLPTEEEWGNIQSWKQKAY
ncbi:hypothetical protein COU74_04960 [Candidatus Peregrinibacteria bacterium CG10_big_fil_rev_8_21_14_0_10_36_19]|nr:MAG: hypothetical protein COU74_04960 [Candidatus Peregrinibacteria bacterium CG10_big_fil_rev_8_21_14_0_10_36_19]